jgi:hypothetical protein
VTHVIIVEKVKNGDVPTFIVVVEGMLALVEMKRIGDGLSCPGTAEDPGDRWTVTTTPEERSPLSRRMTLIARSKQMTPRAVAEEAADALAKLMLANDVPVLREVVEIGGAR